MRCSERYWPDPTISNKHLRIHCILYEKAGNGEVPPLVYATDVSSNGTFLKKSNAACASSQSDYGLLMTRKHGAFLLDHQDQLRISDSVTLIYNDISEVTQSHLTSTQEEEAHQFISRYLITDRLLGRGGFGKVVVAIEQKSQRQLACKIVNLKGFYSTYWNPSLRPPTEELTQSSVTDNPPKRWPNKALRCSREFQILKHLSHPNIISVEKVFCSSNTIYMFQELVTGGDLFSFMERKGDSLTHIDAAIIILQILKAVDYLHDRNIVHRDLKPDNILLTYPEDGARIVITDFGNARVLPKQQALSSSTSRRRMFSAAGTLEYVAPEIYGKNKTMPCDFGYTQAVDMWSVGVITANLLSREAMFSNQNDPRFEYDPRAVILELSSKCDISVIDNPRHHAWKKVGKRPKDFIRRLLVLQESDRMTAKEALAHEWFANEYHAAEFENLYKRAVKDWQPRPKANKLVEPLYNSSSTIQGITPSLLVKSQHFQPDLAQDSSHSLVEQFSGSANWDLSVVYPPIDETIDAEFEEAENEVYDNYDQRIDGQDSQESSSISGLSSYHGEWCPRPLRPIVYKVQTLTFPDAPMLGTSSACTTNRDIPEYPRSRDASTAALSLRPEPYQTAPPYIDWDPSSVPLVETICTCSVIMLMKQVLRHHIQMILSFTRLNSATSYNEDNQEIQLSESSPQPWK